MKKRLLITSAIVLSALFVVFIVVIERMISSPFDVYEDMLECDFSEALVIGAFDGYMVFPNVYTYFRTWEGGQMHGGFLNIGVRRDVSPVESILFGRFDSGGDYRVPQDFRFQEDLYYPPKEPEKYGGFTMVSVLAKTDDFASFFLFKDDNQEYIEITSTNWSLWRYVVDSYHYMSGDTCTKKQPGHIWIKRNISDRHRTPEGVPGEATGISRTGIDFRATLLRS